MTIFVVEARKSGKGMKQPQRVSESCTRDANALNFLIKSHPTAIYFTDNEAEFFGLSEDRFVQETMDTSYAVWERDLHHPTTPPRMFRDNLIFAVAQNWARDFNQSEMYRGRYQFFAVKVTTTRKVDAL